MLPVRNSIDEMCPSPVARRLMMKRRPPGGHAALVRVRHDRGIEDGGGFQRVFAGEQGADEQLPLARKRTLREHVPLHLFVMGVQDRLDVEVSFVELPVHGIAVG